MTTMSEKTCVVVVLTFNSASIIGETLGQALAVSPDVFVVDSGSKDGCDEIARGLGCEVVQRPFVNYSEQRNWAIAQVAAQYRWQLHLDADEVLYDAAVAGIRAVLGGTPVFDAYMLKRRDYFMGRELRFSGVNPWHLRLFRSGVGQCENRLYDQHFVASRPAGKLDGVMHDKNSMTISDWIARHNRWSDLEADQITQKEQSGGDVLQARLSGDARERTRYLKGLYYRLPIASRAFSYFVYRYLFRLGILDGKTGFYFAFFQALWFRMLVDAKLYERQRTKEIGGSR
jgi:glycosyltransferase involved in cell wall biosynthesis